MGKLSKKTYRSGEVYRYEPTEEALAMGDKPGMVEILAVDEHSFRAYIWSGIDNIVARTGREIRVDKGSLFDNGLKLEASPLALSPTVDSDLTFADIIG